VVFGLGGEGDRAGQAAFVDQGAANQTADGVVIEGLQGEQDAARQQRRDHREVRVLGRGGEQRDRAVLDGCEQGVLLCLGEAVHLVDEQDGGRAAGAAPAPGGVDDGADVLDAGGQRGERDERAVGGAGDQVRDGGLAAARRPPEDDGEGAVARDELAQGRPGGEQVALADELVEGPGAHAYGQGRVGPDRGERGTGRLRPGWSPGRVGARLGQGEEAVDVHRHRQYRPRARRS
jgi:hypothetical protein